MASQNQTPVPFRCRLSSTNGGVLPDEFLVVISRFLLNKSELNWLGQSGESLKVELRWRDGYFT